MSYNIQFVGNQHTNSSSRNGHIPFVIVNHISAGTISSMNSWFTSSGNKVSSAHYGVAKDGQIYQYVDIRKNAWANGTDVNYMPKNPAQVWIDNDYLNVNYYSVSIEHEGMDGDLTEEQYQASLWLHNHIRQQIVEIWGEDKWFPLDDYHVLGHFQLHSWKENCPGKYFPWERLYADLKSEGGKRKVKFTKDYQHGMLINALHQLYMKSTSGELDHPLLTDYNWITDAYTGELTVDDLTWLVAILLAKDKGITL